jgi:murein DD-endopeptidase MepM/ murein hydrolase activator NlpD
VKKPRLTGFEPDLYAGWTFDTKNPWDLAQPKLARPVVFLNVATAHAGAPLQVIPAGVKPVSTDRNGIQDALQLPAPFQQTKLQLPFKPGQAWLVARWSEEGTPTHSGAGAFAWDFKLPVNGGVASCGEPLYASAAGTVLKAIDTYNGRLEIQQAQDEYARYQHTYPMSVKVFGGPVTAGQEIAKVGSQDDAPSDIAAKTYKNCHLHFGLKSASETGPTGIQGNVTFPAAFSNYEACDQMLGKNCAIPANWYKVVRGIPTAGQLIRRPL